MAIGTAIGKTLGNGYAGSYSRQPDMVVDTHPAGGAIAFGSAVVSSSGSTVDVATFVGGGSTFTAAAFQGVAVREVKSSTNYASQGTGSYAQGEAVPVMKRGRVNVICQNGTPAYNGDVYVRVAANASLPNAVVGGFEAASDSTNSVKLTNAKWGGAADGNGVRFRA